MAGTVNKVTLVGNLGRDPEVRQTNNGQRIGNMTVATSEQWKDKQTGERREKSEFHRVVLFDDRLVDVAEKYLAKGSKVYVEGQLQTRKFTDQSGAERYMTEVVCQRFRSDLQILSGKDGGQSGGQQGNGDRAQQGPQEQPGGGDDLDDSIPF